MTKPNAFTGAFKIDMKSIKESQNKQAAQIKQRKKRLARGDDYCKDFLIGKNEGKPNGTNS